MPQYQNNNQYDLTLVGPAGDKIVIKRGRKVRLPDFFDRYAKRGFLIRIDDSAQITEPTPAPQPRRQATAKSPLVFQERTPEIKKSRTRQSPANRDHADKRLGKPKHIGATEDYKKIVQSNYYPISNNIGIGILSYNRVHCLKRCIESIYRYTDLKKTTVFISDDNSDDRDVLDYLNHIKQNDDFVILNNNVRLGVAGNTNRLMRCLSRFKYKLLLNDDVEILANDWEYFYPRAMAKTDFHHFCCRTIGVYGARDGDLANVKSVSLNCVHDKPHGAILAYDQIAFDKIGYFDEQFGVYGMEHIDWSDRVSRAKLQPAGYYDVDGSSAYFNIHADRSAVDDRVTHLTAAREYYKTVSNRHGFISATAKSAVPAVSYVVPYRDVHRTKALSTIISNIRAQRYPSIEIVVTEHDTSSKINFDNIMPVKKVFIKTPDHTQFNKSMAFNAGVAVVDNDVIILHDADLLALKEYTLSVVSNLSEYDSCFLGSKVLYASKSSSEYITEHLNVVDNITCDKYVEYFEGGSVGIRKSAYWRIGGFNEDFWGYGNEDCDFYARLASTRFNQKRHLPFLHIWHPRTPGWEICHAKNRQLEARLKLSSIADRISKLRMSLKNSQYAKFL